MKQNRIFGRLRRGIKTLSRDFWAFILCHLAPKSVFKDRKYFDRWQKRGFHVLKADYYSPIPDTRDLNDEIWDRRSEMVGVDMNEQGQLDLLDEFKDEFRKEYDQFPLGPTDLPHQFHLGNPSFGLPDAVALYCMIRHFKPKRMIEIGSGHSTFLAAQALLVNQDEGHDCDFTAIEPYPSQTLRDGFPGLSRLVEKPVQVVPHETFLELGENDILFIDSTHVLRTGSDVQYEYLELLPRLHKGVIVHAHDIFLPGEYPKVWAMEHRWFWNEQYLLHAFLTFNDTFQPIWAGQYLYGRHKEKMHEALERDGAAAFGGGSFWMRKVR
jgi:hypothetical protein